MRERHNHPLLTIGHSCFCICPRSPNVFFCCCCCWLSPSFWSSLSLLSLTHTLTLILLLKARRLAKKELDMGCNNSIAINSSLFFSTECVPLFFFRFFTLWCKPTVKNEKMTIQEKKKGLVDRNRVEGKGLHTNTHAFTPTAHSRCCCHTSMDTYRKRKEMKKHEKKRPCISPCGLGITSCRQPASQTNNR